MTARTKMRVHLMGGLGNQFFIYAAALVFSRSRNIDMAIDSVSAFDSDRTYRREYLLDQFAITAPIAPAHDHFVGRWGWLRWRLMLKAEELGLAGDAWAVIREKTPPSRFGARRLHFFDYWQSEGYFSECADSIRREFQLTAILPDSSQAELAAIKAQPEAVAVGIRRFIERPNPALGYVTPLEFYQAAFAEIARVVPSAHLFLFSEDPEWVRRHVRCPLPSTVVTHKESNRRAYEDLALMRACRHFVIGNSTYHWWGAWLGEEPDSMMIADSQFARDNPEFYPVRWRRI